VNNFSYDTSQERINQTQRELSAKDVVLLNTLQVKGYENTINNWKLNGKKGPIPEPPGSYRVEEVNAENQPLTLKVPEIRFHSEIPACAKYIAPAVPAQNYVAIVGPAVPGFTPTRYQPLDTCAIGTLGVSPDGTMVTKVGVMTPFGPSVWYQ